MSPCNRCHMPHHLLPQASCLLLHKLLLTFSLVLLFSFLELLLSPDLVLPAFDYGQTRSHRTCLTLRGLRVHQCTPRWPFILDFSCSFCSRFTLFPCPMVSSFLHVTHVNTQPIGHPHSSGPPHIVWAAAGLQSPYPPAQLIVTVPVPALPAAQPPTRTR